ncbi:MAPEG family protein [Cupriavidus necator]
MHGSASGQPSPAIKVRMAVLQNSLEQTVLAVGAHLILATVLNGAELRLIPILVFLYLLGRATFAFGYSRPPIGRAFGMAVTGISTIVGYLFATALILAGR